MARTIQFNVSVPLNGTVNDAITGAGINSYFGSAGQVTLYAGARAVGLTHSVSYDDGVDQRTIIPPGSSVSVESTIGALKTNEGFLQQFAVPAGSKLLVNLANSTAGAVIYDFLAIIA